MELLAQGTRVKVVSGNTNFTDVTGTVVGLVISINPCWYIIKPDDETLDFSTGFEEPYAYTHFAICVDHLELI